MSRVPPLKSDAEVTSQLLAEALPLVREGVNQLLEQRPRDAMAFLAEFFRQGQRHIDSHATSKKVLLYFRR